MRDLLGLAFVGVIVSMLMSMCAIVADADAARRDAVDSCLAFGGTVSQCVEAQP